MGGQVTVVPDDVVCDATQVQKRSSMAYADFSCGLLLVGTVGLRRTQRYAIVAALRPKYVVRKSVRPKVLYWPTCTSS